MLAGLLTGYSGRPDVVVLGLPRGGVPVAAEVAKSLGAPLDVFLVRKLGTPGHAELAMGAIASGDVRVLNESVIGGLRISPAEVERVTAAEQAELARRTILYRGSQPPLDVAGRTVIVVDDGLATGSTMRAAVAALRQLGPSRTVVAVPVGAPSTVAEFSRVADEVVCVRQPHVFHAVGEWYRDFRPTTDDEIQELLGLAATTPAGERIRTVDLIGFYERALMSTGKAVASARDDQLSLPTPCADWDVRTLGNHIIGALWVFAGRTLAAGDQAPDYMGGDRAAAFDEAAAAALAAFRRPGALEATVHMPIGPVPSSTALALALLDSVVHAWDLAVATGQNPAMDADLAGAAFEVAKGYVSDDLRARGKFGPPVPVGDDAPVHERLVAFLGRTPRAA